MMLSRMNIISSNWITINFDSNVKVDRDSITVNVTFGYCSNVKYPFFAKE